ncbi:MAG TPA: hypothetical protein VNZ53_55460 [Steroidobacteraceae bacterium]|nr:hypothetical protein [Steroidobacteraceae bacterium]
MSAICRNEGLRAVNDGTLKSTAPSITARPTPQEKRSFAEVAAKLRVSESTLALIAIRTMLNSDVSDLPPRASSSNPAVDRITIRLRPGDRLAIRNRAAERRMKDSAYIAALVRGHVAANPPLATHELAVFKAAVSVLAAFSRLLARTAREAAQAGVLTRDLQQDLSCTRALVADVERRMHEFARAALVTWESRVD